MYENFKEGNEGGRNIKHMEQRKKKYDDFNIP